MLVKKIFFHSQIENSRVQRTLAPLFLKTKQFSLVFLRGASVCAFVCSNPSKLPATQIEKNVKIAIIDTILDKSGFNYRVVENRQYAKVTYNNLRFSNHGPFVTQIATEVINPDLKLRFSPEIYFYGGIASDHAYEAEIYGVRHAIENNVRIINLSINGPDFDQTEYDTLKKASDNGILIVVAAGNERRKLSHTKPSSYPCQYKIKNLICVGSVDNNQIAQYSNWGDQVKIYTDGRHLNDSGTSFSAPKISRALAIAINNFNPTNEELISALTESAATLVTDDGSYNVFDQKEFFNRFSALYDQKTVSK